MPRVKITTASTLLDRRAFVKGAVVAGASTLLSTKLPAAASGPGLSKPNVPSSLDSAWSGPGGVGDYADSNGNTYEVVNAAHSIRDGRWKTLPKSVDAEQVDVVVIGGGFAGLSAAHYCKKLSRASCLVLENHRMFGGEGKRNEILVDGVRLAGSQGSNAFVWPLSAARTLGVHHEIWSEVGLPENGLQWVSKPTHAEKIRVAMNNFTSPRPEGWQEASVGYYFSDPTLTGSGTWSVDPWGDGFALAPVPAGVRADVARLLQFKWQGPVRSDWRQWLDSMTYRQFLEKVVGIKELGVFELLDAPYASGGAMGSDVTSAYYGVEHASARFGVSALVAAASAGSTMPPIDGPVYAATLPGGNGDIVRHIVKSLWPAAIAGGTGLTDVIYGRVLPDELAKPAERIRLRLGATALSVRHLGTPDSSPAVDITYLLDGKVHKVRAKAVIMASGQWINKHVLRDAPEPLSTAMSAFHHAPILNVNVGLRHWRFLERLGISAARWFDGFGWYANLRAPLSLGAETSPLDPARPVMMTMYVPFLPDATIGTLPIAAQAAAGRAELFALTYEQIRARITRQFTAMFGAHGFDAERDIAGLIANRWGHAFVIPQPGFYFPAGGGESPSATLRCGYGRIRFGHTELAGTQAWFLAVREGERAIRQALELV